MTGALFLLRQIRSAIRQGPLQARASGRACLALLLAAACTLCACSSRDPNEMPPPTPAESPQDIFWNYEPGGIRVILDAESDSNLAAGEPHATALCLIQAESREKLLAEAATQEGLRRLLECRPAPPDFPAASLYYVQPGESRVFPLDRYEKTRYIGVVAGFDTLTKEGCLAVVPVPVRVGTRRSYLVFGTTVYSAAPMKLAIRLGQASLSVQGAIREE